MPHHTTIQGIGFDFGRILANFDHGIALTRLAEFSPLPAEELRTIIFTDELSNAHEAGKLSSHDFYANVCKAAEITGLTEDDFARIWSEIFTQNEGIAEVLRQLRPDISKVIISNTDPIHWQNIRTLPVIEEFFSNPNSWVLSFDVGARKPDARMYDAMLERLGTDAAHTLYIDDIEKYVDSFKEMGGNAEQYDCTLNPVAALEEILRTYGCLV